MAYPEPNSLDDIYGPGAEEAEAFAEALDAATERATKAGVSYRTIIGIITALADAAEKDAREQLPEPPDPELPDAHPENDSSAADRLRRTPQSH